MAEPLKLYPSGFLGSSTVLQTKPISIAGVAKQLFNNGLIHAPSKYTASEDVINLWADIVAGTPAFKTFEFKERILKYALAAFGCDTLYQWVSLQVQSPEYTDNHSRWIDETLLYIFAGKTREMSGNNWKLLLTAGTGEAVSKQLSPVVKYFILGESLEGKPGFHQPGLTMKEFILNWVRQPGGIADLSTSLNVLFGNR